MKKLICIVIIAITIFCCTVAQAAVPGLSETMFKYAKGALVCLASGEYDKVVTTLPFSDISPSGDEWRSLAEGSFTSLSGSDPQTQYAVAYWNGNTWKIAVPVSEPSSDGVEVLVLISEDGQTFTGYACATWGRIKNEYQASDYLFWNGEYSASTSVIIENDD